MLSKIILLSCLTVIYMLPVIGQPKAILVNMNHVTLSCELNEKGTVLYAVSFDGKAFIKPSSLGFKIAGDENFSSNFELIGMDSVVSDNSWKPVLGEVSTIRDHHKELTLHLKQKNSPNRLLNIIFRVFEDGVGFRYEFPKQPHLKYFVVEDELTQFNLAGDYKAFWIPGDYDTNEYPYTCSKLSAIDNRQLVKNSKDIAVRLAPDAYAVQTPLMLKTDDGLYINIHEAALINYAAMQLHVNVATFALSSSLVPDATGSKAYLHAPFATPWRTIIVSNKATEILASKIILNLNEPTKLTQTDWIKPMKFIGVWWEMQTEKSGWKYSDASDNTDAAGKLIPNGKHAANTANVKRYIDFAAANNIKGVLLFAL